VGNGRRTERRNGCGRGRKRIKEKQVSALQGGEERKHTLSEKNKEEGGKREKREVTTHATQQTYTRTHTVITTTIHPSHMQSKQGWIMQSK